ncbi:hypothetical protein D187_009853 [Cystobacter fuscus DSM 2262]|uniref:Uncharacterized protein n=1 Tax=Cystobacter fuscus (strain ATCC 25194 / DSM 2262 / NBRC 100088 / M29) TaxID=1242864 RepID=S9PC27_CYSF2|nr:hypothetical protein D187_009853 [Cystobacter fuscus DSM 2262]
MHPPDKAFVRVDGLGPAKQTAHLATDCPSRKNSTLLGIGVQPYLHSAYFI